MQKAVIFDLGNVLVIENKTSALPFFQTHLKKEYSSRELEHLLYGHTLETNTTKLFEDYHLGRISSEAFYENLKKYVERKGRNFEFSRFEVREAAGLGKTQQHYYMNKLLELEYLQQYGFANRGFKYKIVYWDDYTKLREQIKNHLHKQMQALVFTPDRTPKRTPETALIAEIS